MGRIAGWRRILFAAGTTFALAASVVHPEAVGTSEQATSDAVLAIESVAPEVLLDVADISVLSSSGVAADFKGSGFGEVLVPADPILGITLGGTGSEFGIGLPNAENAAEGELLGNGIVTYENGDGSTTVPIIKDDGSLQIATVIADPSAPARYEYPLSLPVGSSARLELESGAVLLLGADGTLLAAVAPAWAKDANGGPVETHYEVNGSVLVQVIRHDDETIFPVVADPWLGKNLFGKVTKNRNGLFKGKATYSSVLSTWGTAVYTGIAQGGGIAGSAAGQAILRDAGWTELKSRLIGSSPPATLKQQYDCHVLGGYAVWLSGVHWDLELARTSKPNWLNGVNQHRCNWT